MSLETGKPESVVEAFVQGEGHLNTFHRAKCTSAVTLMTTGAPNNAVPWESINTFD